MKFWIDLPKWFRLGRTGSRLGERVELIWSFSFSRGEDLLRIKGAGWWKKFFRKIARFFQRVVDAIVKVIQKVTSFITKALTAVFGKVIGGALAGIVNGFINLLTAPITISYYVSHGDWKGLGKYMGSLLPFKRPSSPWTSFPVWAQP